MPVHQDVHIPGDSQIDPLPDKSETLGLVLFCFCSRFPNTWEGAAGCSSSPLKAAGRGIRSGNPDTRSGRAYLCRAAVRPSRFHRQAVSLPHGDGRSQKVWRSGFLPMRHRVRQLYSLFRHCQCRFLPCIFSVYLKSLCGVQPPGIECRHKGKEQDHTDQKKRIGKTG